MTSAAWNASKAGRRERVQVAAFLSRPGASITSSFCSLRIEKRKLLGCLSVQRLVRLALAVVAPHERELVLLEVLVPSVPAGVVLRPLGFVIQLCGDVVAVGEERNHGLDFAAEFPGRVDRERVDSHVDNITEAGFDLGRT